MHFVDRDNSTETTLESTSVSAEPTCVCLFCSKDFGDYMKIQAHLTTQRHPDSQILETEEYKKHPYYSCRKCRTQMKYEIAVTHSCLIQTLEDFYHKYRSIAMNCSPIACLFCNGRALPSRAHLIIHLIVQHCFRENLTRCPICNDVFRTTSKTVFEMHAYQVHVPEYAIFSRKIMKRRIQTRNHTSQPYVCHFPNEKYLYSQKENQPNCDVAFTDLSQFTAHIISQHAAASIPKNIESVCRHFCYCCTKGFSDEFQLKHHITIHHQADIAVRMKKLRRGSCFMHQIDPKYLCYQCWVVFPRSCELQAHIVSAHSGFSWRTCAICDREYCNRGEIVTAAIIWLTIKAHESYHSDRLLVHSSRLGGESIDDEELWLVVSRVASVFFSAIELGDWKKSKGKQTYAKNTLNDYVVEKLKEIGTRNQEEQEDNL